MTGRAMIAACRCSWIRAMTIDEVARIDAKRRELDARRRALAPLVASCRGDQRPDCPIPDDLGGRMPPR